MPAKNKRQFRGIAGGFIKMKPEDKKEFLDVDYASLPEGPKGKGKKKKRGRKK